MRRIVILAVLLLLFSTCVSATGEQQVRDAIPEQAEKLMEGGSASFSDGLRTILENVLPTFSEAVQAGLKTAGVMLAAVFLCALAGGDSAADPARIAAAVCICTAAMAQMRELTGAGAMALEQMQSFADVLLPAMSVSTAVTGGVTAATALYAGTSLFCDVLMRGMSALLLPTVYSYLALNAARTLCGGELLSRLAKLVKWCFQSGIKTILFVFTGYLTVTGLVTGTADATAVKAAKLTLSGVVPVVGSMISDASETVIVGAAAIRNAIGVLGMLAVVAICIGPFLRTAVQLLILKLAAVAGGAMAQKPLAELMDAVTEATGFLLSMLACQALMLLISCLCYLKVTVA